MKKKSGLRPDQNQTASYKGGGAVAMATTPIEKYVFVLFFLYALICLVGFCEFFLPNAFQMLSKCLPTTSLKPSQIPQKLFQKLPPNFQKTPETSHKLPQNFLNTCPKPANN